MGHQWIITFVISLVAAVCRLRAVEAGECRGFSGEASVWPREAKLQKLLVLGPAGDPEGLQGNAVHQRPQVDTQTQCPITSYTIRPPVVVSSYESQDFIDRSDPDAHILPLYPLPARWPASRRVTSSARCSHSIWWSTGRVSMLSVWRPNWWRSI